MRILYLNHNIAWTGTFFRAFHPGRHLVARGHDVTLVTTHASNRVRFATGIKDGLKIVYAPDLLWGPARQGWDCYDALRRVGYLGGGEWDLIHAFDARPVVSIPALRLSRRGRVMLVMDWADWWGRGGTIEERSGWPVRTLFGPVETWFEEAFRTKARGTTVASEALAARARALGVPGDSILRLPHGCDVTGFPVQDRSAARAQLALSGSDPIVVYLGALFRKDADLLFASFRELRQRVVRARLVVLGRNRVRVPQDLASSGAVIRTGAVPYETLQAWLGAADLCVLPLDDSIANRGRWPSKINDYFTAGRAVVMTTVGDAAGLVRESGAGWTADCTPVALGEALAIALADRPGLDNAGKNARRLAETQLSWPSLTLGLEQFYAGLAGTARPPA